MKVKYLMGNYIPIIVDTDMLIPFAGETILEGNWSDVRPMLEQHFNARFRSRKITRDDRARALGIIHDFDRKVQKATHD